MHGELEDAMMASPDDMTQLKARVERLERLLDDTTRQMRARQEALVCLLERKGVLAGQDDYEFLFSLDPEQGDDELS